MSAATENIVGFKETKLGMIPDDWEVKQFKEILTCKGRIGYRGYTIKDIVAKGKGAITLSPSNIKGTTFDLNDCTYISWFKYDESPEIQINNGEILFVKTGSTVGKSTFVHNLSEKATINPQLVVLKEFKCNGRFLSYLIASSVIQRQVKATVVGGAIPTLSQEYILKFNIPLPPLPEQQKIAKILSTWDKAIEKLEQLISEKEQLKKGLMQQLLTGEKRFPGFTDEWEEVKLGDNCSLITKGTTPMSLGFNFVENGVNFIKAENLSKVGVIRISETPKISDECNSQLMRSQLAENDILFSIAGTLGRTAIVTKKDLPANTNQALAIIRFQEAAFDLTFVYHYLRSTEIKKYIHKMVSVGAQPNLNLDQVSKIKLIKPKIAEQQVISNILGKMEKEIAQLNSNLMNVRNQKKGLMKKLLTGAVRVKV